MIKLIETIASIGLIGLGVVVVLALVVVGWVYYQSATGQNPFQ
jgi:cell division septal protein FtsQ